MSATQQAGADTTRARTPGWSPEAGRLVWEQSKGLVETAHTSHQVKDIKRERSHDQAHRPGRMRPDQMTAIPDKATATTKGLPPLRTPRQAH